MQTKVFNTGSLLIAIVALLCSASVATAATSSGSESFDVNNAAPAFNPEPQLRPLTLTASYDDAGVLTLTESGGNVASDVASFEQYQEGMPEWDACDWEVTEIDLTGGGGNTDITIDGFGASLTDNQVAGVLQPQVTASSDGNSVTAVWSNPLLADLGMTYVAID